MLQLLSEIRRGRRDAEAEFGHHELAATKTSESKNKQNEDKVKRLDFINHRLCEKNDATQQP